MSPSEKFCLKWDDFGENVSTSFKDLQKELDFADVTLASDDQQLEVHKVVLASGSHFFRNILKKYNSPKPLIYLRGLKYKELEAIVDFIYNGEVNIFEECLNDFLILAQELQLKGLDNGYSEESKQFQIPKNAQSNRTKLSSTISHEIKGTIKNHQSNNLTKYDGVIETDSFAVSTESSNISLPPANIVVQEEHSFTKILGNIENIEAHKEQINSMMECVDGIWTCTVCGKITERNQKSHMKDHVETHIDASFTCKNCRKTYRYDKLL